MNPRWLSPVLILVSFVVFGVLDGLTASNRAAETVLGVFHLVVLTGLLFWWVSTDAQSLQMPLSTSMIVCLVLFGLLAMPFYLAGTRPTGSWVRWFPKGFALFLLCFASYICIFDLVEPAAHAG